MRRLKLSKLVRRISIRTWSINWISQVNPQTREDIDLSAAGGRSGSRLVHRCFFSLVAVLESHANTVIVIVSMLETARRMMRP